MTYPQLTVFNFKISYFVFRIFTLFWLVQQYFFFDKFASRSEIFYEPNLWIQKLIFPEYPSRIFYVSILILTGILLIYSLFKQSYVLNILLFVIIALVNLLVASNIGMSHFGHLLVLSYFFSIFLLPKNLKSENYKSVQIYYLGLLSTYSLSGIWKLISCLKDLATNDPSVSWFEKNAARYNSFLNYFIIDLKLPDWMQWLYKFENLWIVITVFAIFMQAFCFLGAFNRKLLNIFMVFLVCFHIYTEYFVIAEFWLVKQQILFLFFPYHLFYSKIKQLFTEKMAEENGLSVQ